MATRRAVGGRRRALRMRVLAEESMCGICGYPVDKTLTVLLGQHGRKCQDPGCHGCEPHPMSPEVDHIIPLHQGGPMYERSNVRLSHRRCNVGRNRKASTARPAAPLPTVGDW